MKLDPKVRSIWNEINDVQSSFSDRWFVFTLLNVFKNIK